MLWIYEHLDLYQVILRILCVSLVLFLLPAAFFAATFYSVFSTCGFMHVVFKLQNALLTILFGNLNYAVRSKNI